MRRAPHRGRSRPARNTSRANPGRVAAARALLQVEEGAHIEEVLPELLPEGADRSLGWFLALGALRRRGQVDAALRARLNQPLGGLDPALRAVLRVAAFEKLFGRSREHAVVHQAVEVARALGVGRASGLVNAVLRRVSLPTELSRADALDHPAWLLARWDARYGPEAVEAWCAANAEAPPLTVVAGAAAVEAMRASGLQVHPARAAGAIVPEVWRVEGHEGPVPGLPGFAGGAMWVADAASVAVADLLGEVEGLRILDACAAPGGKAFRLARRGAQVLAVDRSATRLELLRDSASRLGFSIERRVHDWSQGPLPGAEQFDAILLDAPCTGLGVVRRHPEIRWRRQEPDIEAAAQRQRQILEQVAPTLKPGGALVYAVCSPEPEEGRGVVDAFLAAHPQFTEEGSLSTAPPQDDEDAFQAFRLRRRAEEGQA